MASAVTLFTSCARRLGRLALLLCAGHAGAADPPKPVGYYFPRGDACTVMFDYQKQRDRLGALKSDARALELARGMLAEWSANGATKCVGARSVTMLAVYIPGLDIYGRPDFSNRTNLLKLQSEVGKLQALGRSGEKVTMAQIRHNSVVEIF